jgi:protein-tyrosine phosphatase
MFNNIYSFFYTIIQVTKDKTYQYIYKNNDGNITETTVNNSDYVYVERMREKPLTESFYDHISAPFIHVTQIDENIYLGNAFNAADYYYLQNIGIIGIVNASKEISNYFEEYDTNIKYFKLEDVKDINKSSIKKYFDPFIVYAKDIIQNKEGKILIHCFMGSSRSAILVVLYLIIFKNQKLDESIKQITDKRVRVNINKTFITELKEYLDEKNIKY